MQASWFRHLLNCYPPLVGAGIRITYIAPDWRQLRVAMQLRWYNRNYVGTHFGGSLFAMTDPFLMLMVMHNLSRDYTVWDKAAEIEFVAPGRSRVTVEFTLSDSDLAQMRERTQNGEKYLVWFPVEVRGEDGAVVARVRRQLYVRRKRGRAAASLEAT